MFAEDTKQMMKSAISVYNPGSSIEKAIMDAYRSFNQDDDGELPSFACQLVASAIAGLKFMTSWLENDTLLSNRINYFFAPHMSRNRSEMIFVTTDLFVRDLLENSSINSVLHDPITFITLPLAFYLFREYPIHIKIDTYKLKAANKDVDFLEVGGLLISREKTKNVRIPSECILDIQYVEGSGQQQLQRAASTYSAVKTAADYNDYNQSVNTEIAPDVFKIDEHKKNLKPNQKVHDKIIPEMQGMIDYVESGEESNVSIKFENGDTLTLPKKEFDMRFVAAQFNMKPVEQKLYPVIIDNKVHKLDEKQIGDLIKSKMKRSRVVMKLFNEFGVDPTSLDNLQIEIKPLDGKFAETDDKVMVISHQLFEGDFLKENFYVLVHEIFHFLARKSNLSPNLFLKEEYVDDLGLNDDFLQDTEEILSMFLAVAYLIDENYPMEFMWNNVFKQVIEFHFKSPQKAKEFFDRMIDKSKEFLR